METLVDRTDLEIEPNLDPVDKLSFANHQKVLKCFQDLKVSTLDFHGSTGYGYGDLGKEKLDRLWARIVGSEAALVRPQIVSGTHAIALCFYAILRPGDRLVIATGKPYDTLLNIIGKREDPHKNSLLAMGIDVVEAGLNPEGTLDLEAIRRALTKKTRMIFIQRSRGYSWRNSICIEQIEALIYFAKKINSNIITLVDNCYGEFVELVEPTGVGADLIAGSMIKNPGGTLAPGGGYVAGRTDYVQLVGERLTAPGISSIGSWEAGYRQFYQGLFFAPMIVGQAVKGAIWTSSLMGKIGFQVSPRPEEKRTDIIQGIMLQNPDAVIAFCTGLQKGSPIDSFLLPEPSSMPGYNDKIIMAGGTFVQGSTLELSADGPIRPPYAVYLQGGISLSYIKLGVLSAIKHMIEKDLLRLDQH
ncbi:MAG: methionine gamma-lyase family protein [Syntrophomonadaceae bacterium]|nr:methionine gamma-lyase family protein [Syntrophomonadaceae bacterium]